jgi:plasmid stabilization system protein ParE
VKNPLAARRAGQAIEQRFLSLESNPQIGRPFNVFPELRELIIDFGDAGYVALYRYEADLDVVYLLAFRHQREAGYA